ncbi:MAG: hypothetical protein SVX43_16980 [Cyanobacteriota bacterium]|nr:hypothetical protein [Cyanobacteriota bacterium]
MNQQNPPFELEANSQSKGQSPKPPKVSARPPLQLPFENTTPRKFSNPPIRTYLDNIDPAEEAGESGNSSDSRADFPPPPEPRSLSYTLEEMEERLSRRLYWVQRRLVAVEKKVEFQQKILLVLTLIWAGLAYFAWSDRAQESSSPEPTPTEQRVAPPWEQSIPVWQGSFGAY